MMHEFHLKHYPLALDTIPAGWAVSSVRALCGEPQSGFACGRHNSQGRGVVHLRPMNVSSTGELCFESVKHVEPDNDLRVKDGDVLFNNTNSPAWVGKTAPILRSEDWAFSNHMTRLRAHSEIDYRYLAGQLQFLQACGYFRHLCVNHVNQASINGDVLSDRVPILVAPSNEQTRIADRIDELFTDLAAGVAALERVRKKLKRYRSAVLHAAVTGRLTAAWRQEHGPPVESGEDLLKHLLVERRRQWEERTLADYETKGKQPPKSWRDRYQEPVAPKTDDLPELPASWCWVSMDQLAEVAGGVAKNAKQDGAKGMREVPYLRVANVQRGFLDLTEMKTISAKEQDINELTLRDGDVLFTEGGDRDKLGRGWVWRSEIIECIHQNHVFRARLADGINPEFVSHVGNGFGQKWFWEHGKQSVNLASISLGVLRQFPVPLPPGAEQDATIDAISEKLSQIDAMEAEVQRGLARASRLRQAVLKAAFAGRLVEQDLNDEPASELLQRIRSERDSMQVRSTGRPKRAARVKAGAAKMPTATAKRKSATRKARKS